MLRNLFTIRRLFDFKGRASRREWLLLQAAYMVGCMLPLFMAAALTGGGDPEKLTGASLVITMILSSMSGIIAFAGFVALLASAFRRLHDQGNSAVFLLVGLIPFIGPIITLIMMLRPGDRCENEYGPDPREPIRSADETYEVIFS